MSVFSVKKVLDGGVILLNKEAHFVNGTKSPVMTGQYYSKKGSDDWFVVGEVSKDVPYEHCVVLNPIEKKQPLAKEGDEFLFLGKF